MHIWPVNARCAPSRKVTNERVAVTRAAQRGFLEKTAQSKPRVAKSLACIGLAAASTAVRHAAEHLHRLRNTLARRLLRQLSHEAHTTRVLVIAGIKEALGRRDSAVSAHHNVESRLQLPNPARRWHARRRVGHRSVAGDAVDATRKRTQAWPERQLPGLPAGLEAHWPSRCAHLPCTNSKTIVGTNRSKKVMDSGRMVRFV